MKSASENRRSFDIPQINASLNPSSVLSFMSRVKKKLVALAVLFSFEFLSLSLFTGGTFSWTKQHIPAAVETGAGVFKLDSPATTDGGLVRESYGEPTSRPAGFFIVTENLGIFIRSFVVRSLFFRIALAPKLSRFISKSVLNL